MASGIRREFFSQIFPIVKSTSHRPNKVYPDDFALKFNKSNNNIELHLPVKLNDSINPSIFSGLKEVDFRHVTDKKKSKMLVFNVSKAKFLPSVLNNISTKPETFWKASAFFDDFSREKILVEFSSPNIAKPFHMGHLRSTVLGNFLSNLFSCVGHDVVRINYLGDWGTQFGMLNVGLEMTELTDEDIAKSPIQNLYHAYVVANKAAETDASIQERARNIFKQLEEGNFPEIERWKRFRQYTVQELEETYERLGVRFDEYQWESMFGAKEIQDVFKILKVHGVLTTTTDGKQVAKVQHDRSVTLVKSDGSTLYLTRDVAAARYRHNAHKFDRLLYVVDNSQSDHFSAMKAILASMEHDWADKITHIKFGRVRGMSTRKGEVVFLKDILDEACQRVQLRQEQSLTTRSGLREDTCNTLAVSAVIVNDLKQRRQRDYDFDWDKALQMQGDGGIKLQYTHCRLVSLEERSGVTLTTQSCAEDLNQPEVNALVTELARFDVILEKCCQEMEACILVNYLFTLCNLINQALTNIPVKGQPDDLAAQRLLLFISARTVLSQGMRILGLSPLNKM